MLRKYRKNFLLVFGYIISLIIVGVIVWYIADNDPNRGQIRGVVQNFDPLVNSIENDISKEQEISPAHAFAIADLISQEFLENYESFSDYVVIENKNSGYFRVERIDPTKVGAGMPEIIIDKKTGGILQFGIQ